MSFYCSTSALHVQVFSDKQFRTHEAEAKRKIILIATCHRGLSLSYTCYQKTSYAFFNTPLTRVMQIKGRLVTPSPKNKSCEASCLCIACYECWLSSSQTLSSKKVSVTQVMCICESSVRIIHVVISQLCFDS